MDEQQTQQPAQPAAPQGNQSDAEKNKPMAIIGYILPFLFFIPLVTDAKGSKFAKFHVNQQLNLLLFWVAGWIIVSVLSAVFLVTLVLIPLIPIIWLVLQIGGLVFLVLGVINAVKGEMKKLPIIGGFELIK